jgi:hypothetical protein
MTEKARHSLSHGHLSNKFSPIKEGTIMWTTIATQVGMVLWNCLGEAVIGAVITYFAKRR